MDPETSEFTVLVTRLGCNSGTTGQVQEPEVDFSEDEVTLTFVVEPDEPSSADCRGNDQVEYEVALSEPLGDRRLVDGQCASDAEASSTTFCRPDGVRYHP